MENRDFYVKEGIRALSGLPSVTWLLVALGITLGLMHYLPSTQAIAGVVAMILLFAIGKWFGLSKEEVISLTKVPTIEISEEMKSIENLEGRMESVAPLETEIKVQKKFQLKRLLF